MQRRKLNFLAVVFPALVIFSSATCLAQMQAGKAPYPAMARVDQYLAPDENSEIALARSGAPASISDAAAVMVLRRDGYATVVKGSNGFLCLVERSWGAATDAPDFWNPKVRSPICFNPPAARTFAPIFLMKTKLVLAGKSKAEMVQATATALDKKELPPLEPGAMCYIAWSDVLYDVEAAVLKRQRQELASPSDVSCCGQRGEELGSRSTRLASYGGGRP